MENTANLLLPYIMPSQAQKHVTHNEALRMLDAVVQLAVLDRDLIAPPAAPADGDRYLVGAGATGEWAGRDDHIAAWQDGGWTFFEPRPGWLCFVADENVLLLRTDSYWQSVTSVPTTFQDLSLLGIGTVADGENPFAAKLNKALWTARATDEDGSGDLRYTLNKQGAGNVLSLLMQSGWSGRAEIGLVGGDNFSIRVSADGTTWRDALTVDRNNGRIAFPGTNIPTDFAVSLLPDSGRFAGNAAKSETVGAFDFPSYVTLYNGTTATAGGKFFIDNTDYGGSAGTLEAPIRALIDKIREPAYRSHGVEFHAALLTMGSGTVSSPVGLGGVDHYLSTFLTFGPRAPGMTFHAYVYALDAPIIYLCYSGQTIFKNGTAVPESLTIAPADGWVSVTVQDRQNPRESWGYIPTPMNIYTRPGHRYLLACPALIGGITAVDDNIGIIAGINRWLP